MSNDFIEDNMGTRRGDHPVSIRKRSFPDGSDWGSAFTNMQELNGNNSTNANPVKAPSGNPSFRVPPIQSRAN